MWNSLIWTPLHPVQCSVVYSLIDEVDSESIADEFNIGTFNMTHDFDNHITIAVTEGIDPSNSLKGLEETTDSDDEMQKMAASTSSRYTTDRDLMTQRRLES